MPVQLNEEVLKAQEISEGVQQALDQGRYRVRTQDNAADTEPFTSEKVQSSPLASAFASWDLLPPQVVIRRVRHGGIL